MKKVLQLYLHIPFCITKCAYCDFLSFASKDTEREEYVQALIKEIKSYKAFAKEYEVPTIFLGGGTPSILGGKQIQRIMEAVFIIFDVKQDAEITIEANPGTVNLEKLSSYRKSGINRISFGLQSTHNEELKDLGRIHTYEEFLESYGLARQTGFTNINVDLISAIPNQTKASWEDNLNRVIALHPEHISAYSLIVEEGTPFFERDLLLPEEEEERWMYQRTKELLGQAGYNQYEVSNYGKKGYECRHNIGYWRRVNYLGLGLGAASLIEEKRHNNTSDMKVYMKDSGCPKKIWVNEEEINEKASMEEFMFLGLRMVQGVSKAKFLERYGRNMEEVYGDVLKKLQDEKLIELQEGYIILTSQGIDLSNYVLAEFLL